MNGSIKIPTLYDLMHWLKIVYFIALVLAFLASTRALVHRKYILFIPLLALGLFVEVVGHLELFNKSTVDKLRALYTIVEYALLSWIISNFITSRFTRMLIRYSIPVLVVLFNLFEFAITDKSPTYNSLSLIIASPIICLWTILYLFDTVKQDTEIEIWGHPMFWISLGNLLFYSGSFFSYGFGAYLVSKNSTEVANTVFWIARILNIVLYILYLIGFLCLKKKT